MKRQTYYYYISKVSIAISTVFILQTSLFAQQNVEVNGNDVGTWFGKNWMWITGAVVLLLILLLFTGGGHKKRKTRTIIKDDKGDTKKITTIEE